jgi:hypothetical protein
VRTGYPCTRCLWGTERSEQHAAVSLFEITMLAIGESVVLDDLVVGNIVSRLATEIPKEFWKAAKKLRQDDKKYRATIEPAQTKNRARQRAG